MVVVKIGGGEGIDYEAVCDDIAALHTGGERLVLVHGGNALATELATQLGHPPTFITSPSGYSSRLTDRRTLEIFEMAYCGRINKMLVEMLQARGVNAIGLSGLDGGLWRGKRKAVVRAVENGRQRIIRDNWTGRITTINHTLLDTLLDAGYLPVLTPPALSEANEAINVDGDRAAAATAAALQANTLLLLSNVPGLLRNFPDTDSLIPQLSLDTLATVRQESAEGRMRIKLLAAEEALLAGVNRVVIGSAAVANPISVALQGAGTQIYQISEEQPA